MADQDERLPESANDDDIEVGESLEIDVLLANDGTVAGAVVDDLVVATSSAGSVTDEVIDVLDRDGSLVVEDEIVTVYDADGNVIARDETIIAAIDEAPGR